MKGIQFRGGKILLWRLGPIKYTEQSKWDRAPENKGMWAFPWPYFEKFFAEHRYSYLMPKRLKSDEWGNPLSLEWYLEKTGEYDPFSSNIFWREEILKSLETKEKPSDLFIERNDSFYGFSRDVNYERYTISEKFYKEREEWIKKIGTKVLPIRKFWYEGYLYSHSNQAFEFEELSNWTLQSTQDYAKTIKKNRGTEVFDRDSNGNLRKFNYTSSHLEVFLAPGRGKITDFK